MKILIDIGHPAHVHLFKHFALNMLERGHLVHFTCREKEYEIDLIKEYGFRYSSFGKKYTSSFGKVVGLLKYDFMEYLVAKEFKPDIFLSHGSIYAAHAAFFCSKPHISLEDTYNFEQIRLYRPATEVILTGNYEHPYMGSKQIGYSGYHEIAYLHPKYFIPDENIKDKLGLHHNEPYVILRFVAWNASHDIGHKGFDLSQKLFAVKEIEKYARVFISSELPLESELVNYQLRTAPEEFHHVLSFASVVWAESFTIPAECSILGVPSVINHNTISRYLLDQEKKYGMCFLFSESIDDYKKAAEKTIELLKIENINKIWEKKRDQLLSEHIDVTAFLIWFVENYPSSKQIMRDNPDYQLRFK